MTVMSDRFIRQSALLGQDAMDRLKNASVAVFGLGGVGSWAAEALARSAVGKLVLVDFDRVSESNINRQLFALGSTVGQYKAELAAMRARDINPDIEAVPVIGRYTAENRDNFFGQYSYIIDAIDLVSCKLDLIQSAFERNIPIISCLGTGNKLDASQFRISDISKTENDPLARVVRKELRKRGIEHHTVLWSPESAIKPEDTGEVADKGRRSIPGSVSWVPSAAGLMMAGWVVKHICTEV